MHGQYEVSACVNMLTRTEDVGIGGPVGVTEKLLRPVKEEIPVFHVSSILLSHLSFLFLFDIIVHGNALSVM